MLADILQLFSVIVASVSLRKAEVTSYEKQQLKRYTSGSYHVATPNTDKEVVEQVTTLSKRIGLSNPPKVIIYESPYLFAANLMNGTFIVSDGLIKSLSSDERETVLAHELTHSLQKITQFALPIGGTALSIFGATAITQRFVKTDKPQDKTSIFKTALIFMLAYSGVKSLVKIPFFALKRELEKDADRGAVILTGKPDALISKFEKYEAECQKAETGKSPKESSTFLKQLYANHPTTQERIAHVQQLKKQLEAGELKNSPPSRYF